MKFPAVVASVSSSIRNILIYLNVLFVIDIASVREIAVSGVFLK